VSYNLRFIVYWVRKFVADYKIEYVLSVSRLVVLTIAFSYFTVLPGNILLPIL